MMDLKVLNCQQIRLLKGLLLVNTRATVPGPEPRYQGQPVQGFSGVQFADNTGFFLTMDLAQS